MPEFFRFGNHDLCFWGVFLFFEWIQMPMFNSLTAEILVVKTIAPKILSEPCQQKTGSQVPGSRVQRFTVNKNPEP